MCYDFIKAELQRQQKRDKRKGQAVLIFSILTIPTIIMVLAAAVPGAFLMRYIYRKDRLDKEPHGFLTKLFMLGVVSTLCALFTERIGIGLLGDKPSSLAGQIIMNFIIVALSEEGFKYMVLKKASWKSREFNCQFDGVVYAVFVSLGFAIWENILYVFSYGLYVALIRAVTTIPGHACFGVLMGAFYGAAKKFENRGDIVRSRRFRTFALLVPVIAHGSYDLFLSLESTLSFVLFVVLIAVLYFLCFQLVKGLSEGDVYIDGSSCAASSASCDTDFQVIDVEEDKL